VATGNRGLLPCGNRAASKMVKRILKKAPGEVRFCCEAGVCGFDLKRRIESFGCVGIIKCFYGIDTLTAISIITEIFDFGRFASPRDLMSYLGLTPSESSSGEKQKEGSITKSGNKHIRRLLIEISWHYRHPYHVSRELKRRRKNKPKWAIDIADRAGQRLSRRYWYLMNRGKMPCKATTAVARELAGFLWSVTREYLTDSTSKQPASESVMEKM
jgi:hypothetical protein